MSIRYYLIALLLLPVVTVAEQKVSGTTFFVTDSQYNPTGEDTGYWIWSAEGIERSVEGPLGTQPIECYGSGWWDQDGSWGEGICLIGDKDDTRTIRWWKDKGEQKSHWEHLSGTGKFAGMTGSGTYQPESLSDHRSISEWEGKVTLGQ